MSIDSTRFMIAGALDILRSMIGDLTTKAGPLQEARPFFEEGERGCPSR